MGNSNVISMLDWAYARVIESKDARRVKLQSVIEFQDPDANDTTKNTRTKYVLKDVESILREHYEVMNIQTLSNHIHVLFEDNENPIGVIEFKIYLVGINVMRDAVAYHIHLDSLNLDDLAFQLNNAIESGVFKDEFQKIVIHSGAV